MSGLARALERLELGKRIAPVRYVAFVVVLAAVGGIAACFTEPLHALLSGFDVAAVLFLVSWIPLLHDTEPAEIRAHARANDANRVGLLAITLVVTGVVFGAVVAMLATRAAPSATASALAVLTLMLAWLFANLVYAMHYAHLFYMPDDSGSGDAGGLDFPSTNEPDYWDFVYFAFTMGMTFQTSDVAISARRVRQVATFHGLSAFVFNIGVLAFSVNVLGGSSR